MGSLARWQIENRRKGKKQKMPLRRGVNVDVVDKSRLDMDSLASLQTGKQKNKQKQRAPLRGVNVNVVDMKSLAA